VQLFTHIYQLKLIPPTGFIKEKFIKENQDHKKENQDYKKENQDYKKEN